MNENREHDQDCDRQDDYTDGIFWKCLCSARMLNVFAGAKFVKQR